MVQNFNVSRSNIIKWVKNNEKLIDVAKCKYKNHLNIRHPTKYVNLYRVLQKSLMNAEQRLSYKFRLVMVSCRNNISRTSWWWIFKWGRSDDQKKCPKNINKKKCKNDNHIEEKTYQNRNKNDYHGKWNKFSPEGWLITVSVCFWFKLQISSVYWRLA